MDKIIAFLTSELWLLIMLNIENISETLDLLCEIFVPRTSFMVIEDDGKSSFPIIFIQNQQDLDKLIKSNGKQLTF